MNTRKQPDSFCCYANPNHFQPAEVLTAPSLKFAFEPQSETSARGLPTDPSHYTNGRRMLEVSIRIMNIALWQYSKHMTHRVMLQHNRFADNMSS